MTVQTIDVISRNILISVFLLGLLSGATIALIVSAVSDSRRRLLDFDRNEGSYSGSKWSIAPEIALNEACNTLNTQIQELKDEKRKEISR